MDHLVAAKTYVSVLRENTSYEELKNQDTPSVEDVTRFYSLVSVREAANEKVLEQLYDVYQQMDPFGFEKNVFFVNFSGDQEKAKKW